MSNEGNGPNHLGEKGKSVYLFCFAYRNALPAIELAGSHGFSPVARLASNDIVAVFSEVPLGEWTGPSAEANLQDLRWVAPRAWRHEEVVERVMRHCPVLPARFGTIFSSLEKLERLLCVHYDTISEFLDYMADKQEWALKGLLDTAKAEENLLASEHRAKAFPSSSGARYLMEKRLRLELREKLTSWKRTVGTAIAEKLHPDAVEARNLKTLSREASGREMDMAFNWALLLASEACEGFHARVEKLSAEYSPQGLILELTGPWPPYSFCPSLSQDREQGRAGGTARDQQGNRR